MRSAAILRLSLPALSLALSLALVLVGPDLARAQVDTIFVVPGAHFDVGFDDLPSVVREHRIKAVEDALAAAEADPDFHWMKAGEWDQIRSACPVWTWRVREAMRRLRPNATTEVREALATAMDHGLTLGPGWPGKLTEPQTVAHAREQADVFARAVKSIGPMGATLVDSVPRPASLRSRTGPDRRWRDLLADPATIRVRSGRGRVAPFILDAAPRWDGPAWTATARSRAGRRRS